MAKRYFRDFIIMKENNSDYSIQGKSVVGKSVLEIKDDTGKIMFSTSNLKPEIVYRAYIISSGEDKSRGVHIGNIVVNQSGNGTLKYEGDADNILNTGLKISDINSVAIIMFKPEGIITPLIGYKNEEIPWKHNFYDITKENERNREEEGQNQEMPEETENLPVTNPEPETLLSEISTPGTCPPKIPTPEFVNPEPENTEVSEEPQEEIEKDQEIIGIIPAPAETSSTEFNDMDKLNEAVNEIAEEVVYEKEDGLENEACSEEDISNPKDLEISSEDTILNENNIPEPEIEIAKDIEDPEGMLKPDEQLQTMFKKMAMKFNKELRELETYTNLDEMGLLNRKDIPLGYCKSEEISILEEILKKYERSKPFKEDEDQYVWVNINFSDMSTLPIDKRLIMNDPLIIELYKKYKHLILGKDINTNKYLFGVPDVFHEANEKKMEMMGFHMFKCCDLSEVYDDKHGYWLMILNK